MQIRSPSAIALAVFTAFPAGQGARAKRVKPTAVTNPHFLHTSTIGIRTCERKRTNCRAMTWPQPKWTASNAISEYVQQSAIRVRAAYPMHTFVPEEHDECEEEQDQPNAHPAYRRAEPLEMRPRRMSGIARNLGSGPVHPQELSPYAENVTKASIPGSMSAHSRTLSDPGQTSGQAPHSCCAQQLRQAGAPDHRRRRTATFLLKNTAGFQLFALSLQVSLGRKSLAWLACSKLLHKCKLDRSWREMFNGSFHT
jgi:hypothetical protein